MCVVEALSEKRRVCRLELWRRVVMTDQVLAVEAFWIRPARTMPIKRGRDQETVVGLVGGRLWRGEVRTDEDPGGDHGRDHPGLGGGVSFRSNVPYISFILFSLSIRGGGDVR